MCECGCSSGNRAFKLKAPDGWYIVELMPGCDYCDVSPGIQIRHPESIEPMDFGFDTVEAMEEIPDLPTIGKGEYCISMIKCGIDSGEAEKVAIKTMAGTEVDNGIIDEVLAEILGEDFWKEALTGAPSVIYPT